MVLQKAKEIFEKATGASVTEKDIHLFESGDNGKEIDFIRFTVGRHGYEYSRDLMENYGVTMEYLTLYPFDLGTFDSDTAVTIYSGTVWN